MRFPITVALLSLAVATAIPADAACGSIQTFKLLSCRFYTCDVGGETYALFCSGIGTVCVNKENVGACLRGQIACLPSSVSCGAAAKPESSLAMAAMRLDEPGFQGRRPSLGTACGPGLAPLEDWLERHQSMAR